MEHKDTMTQSFTGRNLVPIVKVTKMASAHSLCLHGMQYASGSAIDLVSWCLCV